jgi:hypothetical protein
MEPVLPNGRFCDLAGLSVELRVDCGEPLVEPQNELARSRLARSDQRAGLHLARCPRRAKTPVIAERPA